GAVYVQRALGATRAAAFDLSAACTGFIYGLTVGTALVRSGSYRNVLVIGAGAGAAVVSRAEAGTTSRIVDSYLRADGNGSALIEMPGGGSRMPPTHETVDAKSHFLR